MANKYNRHQSVISRQNEDSEDYWLKQFQQTLEKGAVQARPSQSLFDQITSIMNGKSKHTSVEAAVEDMKERSGLTAYLNNLNKTSHDNDIATKTAADQQNAIDKTVPIVISKYPGIKGTIENYIRDTRGNLPIPAVIDKVRAIHKKDVSDDKDWEDEKLIRLVSKLNLEAKKNNPSLNDNYNNLGRQDNNSSDTIDPSNVDAFYALMPTKI